MRKPLSPMERAGWLVALLIVLAMGVIALVGPFRLVNKPGAACVYHPLMHGILIVTR